MAWREVVCKNFKKQRYLVYREEKKDRQGRMERREQPEAVIEKASAHSEFAVLALWLWTFQLMCGFQRYMRCR